MFLMCLIFLQIYTFFNISRFFAGDFSEISFQAMMGEVMKKRSVQGLGNTLISEDLATDRANTEAIAAVEAVRADFIVGIEIK